MEDLILASGIILDLHFEVFTTSVEFEFYWLGIIILKVPVMTHKHGSVFDWQGEGVEGVIVIICASCTRLEELVVVGGLK